MTKTFTARDILTYLFAECSYWDEDVDGDIDSSGRTVVDVTHTVRLSDHTLSELLDMAGIEPNRYDETAFQRLTRATDEDIERDRND